MATDNEAAIAAWCVDCGARFTEAEIADRYTCPSCGSGVVLCIPDDDVTVAINWHELHILIGWAENLVADHYPRYQATVKAIAKRLQEQFPSLPPLTIAGRLAQLAEMCEVQITGPIQPDPDALPSRRQ